MAATAQQTIENIASRYSCASSLRVLYDNVTCGSSLARDGILDDCRTSRSFDRLSGRVRAACADRNNTATHCRTRLGIIKSDFLSRYFRTRIVIYVYIYIQGVPKRFFWFPWAENVKPVVCGERTTNRPKQGILELFSVISYVEVYMSRVMRFNQLLSKCRPSSRWRFVYFASRRVCHHRTTWFSTTVRLSK